MPRFWAPSFLLAVLAALPSHLQAAAELEPLRALAVQDGGRVKPLDSFARETARRVGGARVFGAESIAGREPLEWLVGMMADPERWKAVPMVRVTQAELRTTLALPDGRDRFSFDELVGNARFMEAVRHIEERTRDREASLTPTEQAVSDLYDTLALLGAIFSGETPRLFPGATPSDSWAALAQPHTRTAERRAALLTSAYLAAYRNGDLAGALTAGETLAERMPKLSPAAYPAPGVLEREVRYNQIKPFRLASFLYLGGAVLLLLTVSSRARWLILPLVAAFGVHTYGLVLRTVVAGRAPVTNMYESIVFVAWGAVLLALILEWSLRSRYATASAALLAVACLVIADSVPIMNGAIGPLVPVLRDNFWLTTHVLTISLGYAALMLATGIAHVVLALWWAGPRRLHDSQAPRLLYRCLQAGTLLLAAGTLLGGVWASYAWGRFWGWDPKETWALIALLGYLVLLHARSAGLVREFGLAVGSVAAFLGVLMAWYGVNFVLGTGLHSYGFGAGGVGYVAGFAVAELVIAAAAVVTWRRRHATSAAVPAIDVVHART
jgi:cytochrome c-type biogenesis protein CcsB